MPLNHSSSLNAAYESYKNEEGKSVEEKQNHEQRGPERPPLKFNYRDYSNTYFYPKNVASALPHLNKLNQINNDKISEEEKITHNLEGENTSASSTSYNSFQFKINIENSEGALPYLHTERGNQ